MKLIRARGKVCCAHRIARCVRTIRGRRTGSREAACSCTFLARLRFIGRARRRRRKRRPERGKAQMRARTQCGTVCGRKAKVRETHDLRCLALPAAGEERASVTKLLIGDVIAVRARKHGTSSCVPAAGKSGHTKPCSRLDVGSLAAFWFVRPQKKYASIQLIEHCYETEMLVFFLI